MLRHFCIGTIDTSILSGRRTFEYFESFLYFRYITTVSRHAGIDTLPSRSVDRDRYFTAGSKCLAFLI